MTPGGQRGKHPSHHLWIALCRVHADSALDRWHTCLSKRLCVFLVGAWYSKCNNGWWSFSLYVGGLASTFHKFLMLSWFWCCLTNRGAEHFGPTKTLRILDEKRILEYPFKDILHWHIALQAHSIQTTISHPFWFYNISSICCHDWGSFLLTPATKPGLYPGILVWNSPWPMNGINSSLSRDVVKKNSVPVIMFPYFLWNSLKFIADSSFGSIPANGNHPNQPSKTYVCAWTQLPLARGRRSKAPRARAKITSQKLISLRSDSLMISMVPGSKSSMFQDGGPAFLKNCPNKKPQKFWRLPKKNGKTRLIKSTLPKNLPPKRNKSQSSSQATLLAAVSHI